MKHLDEYQFADLSRIMELFKTCRDNMHEPDEQGFYAQVIGRGFDNACVFDSPATVAKAIAEGTTDNFDLAVVIFQRTEVDYGVSFKIVDVFNLANLFAIIRYLKDRVDNE